MATENTISASDLWVDKSVLDAQQALFTPT